MKRAAARSHVLALLAATVMALLGACGDSGQGGGLASGPADPTDARLVGAGKDVYLAQCASCHGMQLEGQPNWQEPLPDGSYPAPPHDGRGHTWRHSDEQLFRATKFGGGFSAAPDSVSGMPGFEKVLADDEIWAVLAFVKSQWPAELQARQHLLSRMGSGHRQSGHEGHTGHIMKRPDRDPALGQTRGRDVEEDHG